MAEKFTHTFAFAGFSSGIVPGAFIVFFGLLLFGPILILAAINPWLGLIAIPITLFMWGRAILATLFNKASIDDNELSVQITSGSVHLIRVLHVDKRFKVNLNNLTEIRSVARFRSSGPSIFRRYLRLRDSDGNSVMMFAEGWSLQYLMYNYIRDAVVNSGAFVDALTAERLAPTAS